MQIIGQYYLIDRGAFNVDPEVIYTDLHGKTATTGSYGTKMAGQSITFSPGSKSEIQDNYTVKLKVSVVLGRDRTAAESFEFQSGNNATANYAISKMTGNSKLKFLGITYSLAESEKLAAEYVDDHSEVADNN